MENSMLTGMRAMDIEGRITYVNPAFCAMTGFAEAELIGRCRPSLTGRPTARREQPPAAAGAAGPQPGRRHRGEGDAQGRHAVRLRACTSRR
jgi:PAS domain-containing protein